MSDRYVRESIIDAVRDAWETVPELSFGSLVDYIFSGENPQEVGDEELKMYLNDFILNNM